MLLPSFNQIVSLVIAVTVVTSCRKSKSEDDPTDIAGDGNVPLVVAGNQPATGDGVVVVDGSGGITISDDGDIDVNPAGGKDVDVGVDKIVKAETELKASVKDIGTGPTYAWTKVSGPGTITFATPNSAKTKATASADGSYVVRMTVTYPNGKVATDELTFVWDATPPAVSAGPDQTKSASFTQTGTASDANGVTVQWSVVPATNQVTFGTPTAKKTTVVASADGTYTLRLTATDAAGNVAHDDMQLVWDTLPPAVNAGVDRATGSFITQDATVTDATAVTYQWTKVSGPGTITFGTPTAQDTTISATQDGLYVLRLTATDSFGRSASDDMQLLWSAGTTVVDRYSISIASPNVNAGDNLVVQVTAKDASNATVTSVDAALNFLTFTWTGAANAVDATPPLWQTSATFTNGVATFTHKLYKAESISSGTIQVSDNNGVVRSGTYAGGAVTIAPGPATDVTVDNIATQIANAAFSATASVTDAWDNPTAQSCTTMAVTGGTTSAGGHGQSAMAPTLPSAAAQDSLGHYTLSVIKLFATGTNNLTFTACGLTGVTKNVDVTSTGTVAGVTLHTTNTVPAAFDNGASELFCPLSSTDASVACAPVYAFFWDAYGNNIDGLTASCPAWSYTTIGSAPSPMVLGTGRSYAVNNNNYLNGNLTCTNGAASASVNTFGGVSHVKLTHNYTSPGPVVAGLDNITISKIELMRTRGVSETEEAYPFASASSETVAISTNSADSDIGQPASQSCTFTTAGACNTALPFDMTLHESGVAPVLNTGNRQITVTVRGKSAQIASINVRPAAASALSVAAIGTQTAGTAFGATVTARDAFNNLTDGAGTAKDCTTASGMLDVGGGTDSLGGHSGAVTNPVRPQDVAQGSYGTFAVTGIKLHKKGSETLTFTACGLAAVNANVTVQEGAAASVYYNTSDVAPPDAAAPYISELKCANSGAATAATVTCPAIYAFFYDAYGNALASNTCDSWSYTTISGAPAPTVSGATHSYTLTHTNYIDGNLKCTKGTVNSTTLNTYGGVAYIEFDSNYDEANDPIRAANDNVSVTQMRLFSYHNGVAELKTDSGTETIGLATTSTLGMSGLGYASSSTTCNFGGGGNLGKCMSAIPFDFTKHESNEDKANALNYNNALGNRSLTLTVRGKSLALNSIDVFPAAASTLSVTAIPTQTAGTAFAATVTVRDAFNNPTDGWGSAKDCTTSPELLDVTGGTDSPGGHSGAVTTPVRPQDVAMSSVGGYSVSGITLYKKASETLTFTACGLTAVNSSVTVQEAGAASVYYNTSDVAPPDVAAPYISELKCANSGAATASNVTCGAIYAFFYDAYGNSLTSNACDSWSYATIGGAPAPTVSGATHSYTLTHTDYIDGNLKCTKGSVNSTTLNTYGGVAYIEFDHDYVEANDPIRAANDNVNVTQMRLFSNHNGVAELKTDAGTETISLATNSTLLMTGLGYASSSTTCNFGGGGNLGKCMSAIPFDFTKHESNEDKPNALNYNNALGNRSLTLTVRGKSLALTGIDIFPAAAATLTVTAIPTRTAGTAFTATASVRDAFNNPTDGWGSAKDCTTAGNELDVAGGLSSPGGHQGAVTAPAMPVDVLQNALGAWTTGNITLYRKATESLTFTACGLTGVAASVVVQEAGANTVYYNTSDVAPPDVASPYISQLECPNTGAATGSNVTCGTLYAFFYDAYGNSLTSTTCDSWSYATIGAAPAPTVSGATHSYTLTHTNYIDGNLKCTKGSVNSTVINTYGGISNITIASDYTPPTAIYAANSNIGITDITLKRLHNGVEETKTFAAGTTETIGITTTTSSTIGNTPTYTCVFNTAGRCTSNTRFNFTVAEYADLANGNKSLTATVRGRTASLNNINIKPTAAYNVYAYPISAQVAGTPFAAQAAIRDQFGNITDEGCTSAVIATTGGTSSPGGHTGTVTAPIMPSNVTTDSAPDGGHFTTGNITLFNEATNTLTFTVSGCTTAPTSSSTINQTVAVSNALTNVVYLNTVDTAPGASALPSAVSEVRCSNLTTGSNATTCNTVYAFFWDAYGNRVDDAANACGSWTFTNISGSGTPAGAAGSHSLATTHTAYIDGTLTCTKDGKTGSILSHGGISRVEIDHNYSGTVIASNANMQLQEMRAFTRRNNVEIQANNIAGSRSIGIATTLTQGAANLGQTNPFACAAFSATGVCPTDFNFNLTTADTNKTITFSLFGISAPPITNVSVTPNTQAKYRVTSAGATKTAGVGFPVTVTVYDAFNNVVTGFHQTDNLSFAWAGTTATNSMNGPGHGVTPVVLAAGNRTFSYGVWTSGATDFMLYNKSDATPVLNMTSNTLGLPVEQQLTGLTTTHNSAVNYGKIQQVNTANTAWGSELTTWPMTADDTKVLYNHGYDAWGNNTGLVSATWSGSSALAGRVSPTTGTSTTVSPTVIGTGTVTATPSVGTADSTGTFTVTPGAAATFSITRTVGSPTTAGQDFGVTLTALDADGNTATGYNGTYSITWTTPGGNNAPLGTAPKKPANGNQTFSLGVFNSAANAFALYNGSDTAAAVRAVAGAVTGQTANFAMAAAAIQTLEATAVTAKEANEAFNIGATLLDSWRNPSNSGCSGNLTVSNPGGNTSPGGHGGAATAPSLPAAVGQDTTGHYTTASTRLFKEGSNTLNLAACAFNTTVPVTVTSAPVNTIYMNNANTAPASHLASVGCTVGTTVTCPTLYSFAWDSYGNEVDDGVFSCASYTRTTNNTAPYDTPLPSLSNSSGHSTALSSADWHVDAGVKCTTGGKEATTAMTLTKINKTYGFSCGNWSCAAADQPRGTCTITNNSGYATSAFGISGAAGGNTVNNTACAAGLAAGGTCNVLVDGTTGTASGSLAVTNTVSGGHLGFVNISNPASRTVASGAVAPNCSAVLSHSLGAWSCVSGSGRRTVTLTNGNGVESAVLPNTAPSFSPIGGYTFLTNNCRNVTLAPGQSCVDTLQNPTAAQATTLTYTPSGAFFDPKGVSVSASPDCSQGAAVQVSVQSACAGTPKNKTLRVQLRNNNSLLAMSFPAGSVTPADGGVVSNDTCSSGNLAAGGAACTFDVTYTNAPATNTLSLSVAESSSYFNNVSVTTADGNNSCP